MNTLSDKNVQIRPKQMSYSIIGDPIPLQRPRFGHRRVYDGQREVKISIINVLENQHGDLPLFQGPLELEITFYFAIPKSARKHNLKHAPHYYKPDLSNLVKFIEDIANDVIFADDALIARLSAKKVYDEAGHTEFTVRELQ